jgi:hypothetical protein
MESVKIFLVICTLTMFFCAGCMEDQPTSPDAPVSTTPVTTLKTQTIRVDTTRITATLPVLTEDNSTSPVTTHADSRSFNPLPLKSTFLFGSGTGWISEVAVNRIWINDTYRWYNPENLQYDTRIAPPGKKYLFIFVSMVNRGTEPLPLPPQGNFYVQYYDAIISPYTLHPLPMANPDSTPRIARIAEIEYSHKVYSSEFVEDFGYSHGQKLGSLMPGESNAVEGYIIYEVPASLTPEKTYVRIVLPDKEEATWVLG